jgi:hypothetical protein
VKILEPGQKKEEIRKNRKKMNDKKNRIARVVKIIRMIKRRMVCYPICRSVSVVDSILPILFSFP